MGNKIEDIPENWTPEEEQQYTGFKKGIEQVYNLVIEELPKMENKEQQLAVMRIINTIRTLDKIPRQCDPDEIKFMQIMRKSGYSIRDIAFVHQRSTSTVQDHVKHIRPDEP